MRSLAFALAIGAAALLFGGSAEAIPMQAGQNIAGASELQLVRDGCGRGYRWSNRREACVPDYDGGPPPPAVYIAPVPRYVAPPPRYVAPPPRYVDPPIACPPGMRYSNYRQACVWR